MQRMSHMLRRHEALLTHIDKTWVGMSRIRPYGQSNANTFVRARIYQSFPDLVCQDEPRGDPSGPLALSGLSSWLIPPHLVGKSYTHSAATSIVTMAP